MRSDLCSSPLLLGLPPPPLPCISSPAPAYLPCSEPHLVPSSSVAAPASFPTLALNHGLILYLSYLLTLAWKVSLMRSEILSVLFSVGHIVGPP